MFLSGFKHIDFGGIGSLSGDMSSSELYGLFRNAIPQYEKGLVYDDGATDEEIRSVINAFFGRFEIKQLPSDPGFGESVTASIQPIVINTVGAQRALRYKDTILGILTDMGRRGLYAVPIGYKTPTQQQSVPQAQATSNTTTPAPSIAYQGAVIAQQTGAPQRTAQQQTTQSQTQDPVQSAFSTIASTFGIQSQRTGLPNIYRRVPHKQTPAERQRLVWIIGGFGVALAIAVVAIAARSGD